MAKVETVTLSEFSMDSYELDGPIDALIKELIELRDEGKRQGLVCIRVSSDYVDEPVYVWGGGDDGTTEKIWTVSVVGEKRSRTKFKTKLPKAQYNSAFNQGLKAARNGLEREFQANGTRWAEAWLDGFDSHKDVHTEHCCSVHGCKYGDDDCPVETGKKMQSFPCEACDFDDGRDAYLKGIMEKD